MPVLVPAAAAAAVLADNALSLRSLFLQEEQALSLLKQLTLSLGQSASASVASAESAVALTHAGQAGPISSSSSCAAGTEPESVSLLRTCASHLSRFILGPSARSFQGSADVSTLSSLCHAMNAAMASTNSRTSAALQLSSSSMSRQQRVEALSQQRSSAGALASLQVAEDLARSLLFPFILGGSSGAPAASFSAPAAGAGAGAGAGAAAHTAAAYSSSDCLGLSAVLSAAYAGLGSNNECAGLQKALSILLPGLAKSLLAVAVPEWLQWEAQAMQCRILLEEQRIVPMIGLDQRHVDVPKGLTGDRGAAIQMRIHSIEPVTTLESTQHE